ncbi:MAG TPA: hypothetical protein VKM94_04815 [Blastocatellia bacterium]|nr:hypothetical protein [Blastocatellia bacterium]
MTDRRLRQIVLGMALIMLLCVSGAATATVQSGLAFEGAYADGALVTIGITAPTVTSKPLESQLTLYLVVYPNGFESLGIGTPICDPCDHGGNGIDPTDFHDHVLSGLPQNHAGGKHDPAFHLFQVQPAYTGVEAHDASVTLAYAGHLPATSNAAVAALLSARLNDGSPVATISDTNLQLTAPVIKDHPGR